MIKGRRRYVLARTLRTLLCVLLVLALVGCGGGSESGSGSGTSTTPASTAAAKDVVSIAAPYDLAVAGETYSEGVNAVSADSGLTISSYRIEQTGTTLAGLFSYLTKAFSATTTTMPTISSNGTITWNPTDADIGVHTYNVFAVASNGTETSISVTIEVAKRIQLINSTCGNEGGTFADTNGEYFITIPANALADGASEITINWSIVRRINGTVVNKRFVKGMIEGATYLSDEPVTPVAEYSDSNNANYQQMGIESGFKRVDTYKGYYYKDAARQGISIYVKSLGPVTSSTATYSKDAIDIATLDGTCDSEAECQGKQPVIFVHGFTIDDKLGGGVGTWGKTFEFTKNLGDVQLFEFKWITNARFEDQAYNLAMAIFKVQTLTKKKPIVIAHSFGGVLVNTYLTGNAEFLKYNPVLWNGRGIPPQLWTTTKITYSDNILEVITIGSPLSGIAGKGSDKYPHAYLGTTGDNTPYDLIQGRDSEDFTIAHCAQMSCAEAGFGGTELSYNTRYYTYYPFKLIFALPAPTSVTSDWKNILGFSLEAPGSVIDKIKNVWSDSSKRPSTPIRVLIGSESDFGTGLRNKGNPGAIGDGLISVHGQSLLPNHLSEDDFKTTNGFFTPLANSNIPSNVKYFFMASNNIIPNKFVGFAHTTVQSVLLGIGSYTWPEVELLRVDGKLADNSDFHPLAANIKAVVENAKNQTGEAFQCTRIWTVAKANVKQKPRTSQIPVLQAIEGAPFPFAFIVNKVLSDGSVEQIYRKDGNTDADGQLTVNFEKLFLLEETVPTANLRIVLVVGNSATHIPKTINIDEWRDLLDLGTIELTRRDDVNALVDVAGKVIDAQTSSTGINAATIKIRMGDNLSAQSFNNLANTTTTRILTTDATGAFSMPGLKPGRYTALIAKSGYQTTKQTFDIADTGTANLTFSLIRILADGMGSIRLTWGASPAARDLDSHLIRLTGDVVDYHIFYDAKFGLDGDFLDRDDTEWDGPETTTFKLNNSKKFVFLVHNYSGDSSIPASAPAVVLQTGSVQRRLTPPVSVSSARWWHVFTLNNGVVTPCSSNCMYDTMPTDYSLFSMSNSFFASPYKELFSNLPAK